VRVERDDSSGCGICTPVELSRLLFADILPIIEIKPGLLIKLMD
jgi:hypothetical protein